MDKRILSLNRLTHQLFRNGSREMNGRLRGARIREVIEKILRDEKGSLRVIIDFSRMTSIDFSWADEVIAKMVSRSWSGEYGEKFLILKNLNPSQAENIDVALERKKLAVLSTGPDGWQIVGSLNNYLAHTLNQVMRKRQITLRELSEEEGIERNTSGTRLLNLYRKRLVVRVESPMFKKEESHRGRQYVYRSLLS